MSTIDFRVTSAQLGASTRIISLGGEVDLHTAPQLKDALDAAIAEGAHRVIVDFEGVSFIDSTVVGTLLSAHRRLRADRGDLIIVCADRRILRTFEVTGLSRKFRVAPSLADLLAGNGR